MKTDNFDDAIRRKVESIHELYGEDDISRVHSYVIKKRALAFKPYGTIGLLSLLGLLIAGLLSWSIVQFNENKALRHTVDVLQKNLALETINIAMVKTDTVYITGESGKAKSNKYVKEKHTVIEIENVSKQNVYPLLTSTFVNKQNTHIAQDELKTNQGDSPKTWQWERTSNGKENTILESTSAELTTVMDQRDSFGIVDVLKKNDSVTNPIDMKNLVKSIASSEEEILADTLSTEKKHNIFSSLSFKNSTYQVGLMAEMANGQMGYGVMGGINFNKHWSFSGGIKMLHIDDDKFRDAEDFHRRKGRNFGDTYAPDVPDTSFISGIETRYSLIQIPVSLAYHFLLRNDFALTFAFGTDIDLYAVRHIGYQQRGFFDPHEQKHFETQLPTVAFNNATVSVGIQKQWKHFVIQASPFVSPQFMHVPYKREDLYYGLRISTLYGF